MAVYIEWFHVSEKEPIPETDVLVATNATVIFATYHGKSKETGELVFTGRVNDKLWNINYWANIPNPPNVHTATSDATGYGDSELVLSVTSPKIV
jgi:hypothetical protein